MAPLSWIRARSGPLSFSLPGSVSATCAQTSHGGHIVVVASSPGCRTFSTVHCSEGMW
jgi:hypothetical protein